MVNAAGSQWLPPTRIIVCPASRCTSPRHMRNGATPVRLQANFS
jgi:hypothetical protein